MTSMSPCSTANRSQRSRRVLRRPRVPATLSGWIGRRLRTRSTMLPTPAYSKWPGGSSRRSAAATPRVPAMTWSAEVRIASRGRSASSSTWLQNAWAARAASGPWPSPSASATSVVRPRRTMAYASPQSVSPSAGRWATPITTPPPPARAARSGVHLQRQVGVRRVLGHAERDRLVHVERARHAAQVDPHLRERDGHGRPDPAQHGGDAHEPRDERQVADAAADEAVHRLDARDVDDEAARAAAVDGLRDVVLEPGEEPVRHLDLDRDEEPAGEVDDG